MTLIRVFDLETGKSEFTVELPSNVYRVDAWRFISEQCPLHGVDFDGVDWEYIDENKNNRPVRRQQYRR